jgi:hypothetical protein
MPPVARRLLKNVDFQMLIRGLGRILFSMFVMCSTVSFEFDLIVYYEYSSH